MILMSEFVNFAVVQVSSEACLARERVDQLLEELEDAKEGMQRSDSRAQELQRRNSEGR